jgi:hypothetical protein
METSATYICPIRGLAGLAPPDPDTLWRAASAARELGLQRLYLPVLEEPLIGARRQKIQFVDGLIAALDRLDDARLLACLIVPAQRILGIDWVSPYLVRPGPGPRTVFTAGKVRKAWPYDWWRDPSIIEKRVRVLRELVDAVAGHPGIGGWLIMDRALEWVEPAPEAADLVLKSYLAEIRARDEVADVCIGLGWKSLLDSIRTARGLMAQVDRIRIAGLESPPPWISNPMDLSDEMRVMDYLGGFCQWLFERPVSVELGWGLLAPPDDPEKVVEAGRYIAGQNIAGVNWLSLTDPRAPLRTDPPWGQRPGLERVGLLDWGMELKDSIRTWFEQIFKEERVRSTVDFIDVSREVYFEDPEIHLARLWDHFRES